MVTRRHLLKIFALVPMLGAAPAWAANAAPRRCLLLIELNGGNDGLNSVIPYADPAYAQLRPRLALPREQVIALDERTSLHPALQPLKPLFDDGEFAIVQGLGYPEPNRSHFRGVEIWDTASGPGEYRDSGWLAPAAQRLKEQGGYSAHAAVIGRNPLPMAGEGLNTITLNDSERFLARAGKLGTPRVMAGNPALEHIVRVQQDIRDATRGLAAAPLPKDFPNTDLGRDLAEAARLLKEESFAPMVKVAHSGFDTHANQAGMHQKLLRELADGLVALRRDLKASGHWDRTLVMTYSEFGRRVRENGNKGTDHGTAAPQFVLGGAVKGGLYGAPPSLTDLNEGDLRNTEDFRAYYNTVLARWWGFNDLTLDPKAHPPLDFV